jgi:hypothetical protein
MKYYIGIDPGAKGFVSVIDETGKFVEAFPLCPDIKVVDETVVSLQLQKLWQYEDNCHVIIEDVHSIHGSSAASNFSFGCIFGMIRGIIVTLGMPYTKVAPKTWQKIMHQGVSKMDDKKKMSFVAVHRIFPTVELKRTKRCTTEDDNFADSLLMAEYGRRKNF